MEIRIERIVSDNKEFPMKINRLALLCVALVSALALGACSGGPMAYASPVSPTTSESVAITSFARTPSGFDALGYNYKASLFNGLADGVDGILDGKYYGNPFFANDHLVYNWNDEYDRGMKTNWSDPAGYAGAWTSNQWNGQVPGGSGVLWHYKIIWVGGNCGPNGTPLPDGGMCLNAFFEALSSQGSINNEHFFQAHAVANGYGRKK